MKTSKYYKLIKGIISILAGATLLISGIPEKYVAIFAGVIGALWLLEGIGDLLKSYEQHLTDKNAREYQKLRNGTIELSAKRMREFSEAIEKIGKNDKSATYRD